MGTTEKGSDFGCFTIFPEKFYHFAYLYSHFKKYIKKKKNLTHKVILNIKGIHVEIGGKRDTFLEIEEKRETS